MQPVTRTNSKGLLPPAQPKKQHHGHQECKHGHLQQPQSQFGSNDPVDCPALQSTGHRYTSKDCQCQTQNSGERKNRREPPQSAEISKDLLEDLVHHRDPQPRGDCLSNPINPKICEMMVANQKAAGPGSYRKKRVGEKPRKCPEGF